MGLVDHEMRIRKLEATPPGEDPRVDGIIEDVENNTTMINQLFTKFDEFMVFENIEKTNFNAVAGTTNIVELPKTGYTLKAITYIETNTGASTIAGTRIVKTDSDVDAIDVRFTNNATLTLRIGCLYIKNN